MHLTHLFGMLTMGLIPLAIAPGAEATAPQPLVVLYIKDPWLMVIGSDSPRFALYDDGLVIYASGDREPEKAYLFKKLSSEELNGLVNRLNLDRKLGGLDGKVFTSLSATDQPRNILCYRVNGKRKAVEVYGPPHHKEPGNPGVDEIPLAFLDIFDFLTTFHARGESTWLPAKIEVMIWPFDNSLGEPMPWPREWPGIDDPRTRKRGNDSYSIYLDSRHFPDFLTMLRSMSGSQALLLDDKKWAVSYRFPFPGGF